MSYKSDITGDKTPFNIGGALMEDLKENISSPGDEEGMYTVD